MGGEEGLLRRKSYYWEAEIGRVELRAKPWGSLEDGNNSCHSEKGR